MSNIKKFDKKPATNIPRWLYEREKEISPNPLKNKISKTIKKTKIIRKNKNIRFFVSKTI